MSQPRPTVRPPDPSITVKAPIQVPSPISGSPITHACGLYGFAGRADSSCWACGRCMASDDLGVDEFLHARLHVDRRLPAEHLAGAADVGGPARDEDLAGVELRLHV